MHQKVGLAHLVERRLERLDKLRRQLADKTDGIRQQEWQVVEDHLSHRRVERSEEFVFGKDITLRYEVHERRLAHVGISHQSHTHQRPAVRTLHRHLAVDLGQILLQLGYAVAHDTAVGLDLALARAASRTRTASLSLEVRPQTRQSRQHVFVMRQLDLCLGVCRTGARHEDIEYQSRAVHHAARQGLLDVARLRGRELVVEDGDVDLVVGTVCRDLLDLAGPDIETGRGLRQALRKAADGIYVGRLGQKLQLGEELLGLGDTLAVSYYCHNDGACAALRLGSRGSLTLLMLRTLLRLLLLFRFCHP